MGLELLAVKVQISDAECPLVGEVFNVAVHEGRHVGRLSHYAYIQEARSRGEESAHFDFLVLFLVVVADRDLYDGSLLLVETDEVEILRLFGNYTSAATSITHGDGKISRAGTPTTSRRRHQGKTEYTPNSS